MDTPMKKLFRISVWALISGFVAISLVGLAFGQGGGLGTTGAPGVPSSRIIGGAGTGEAPTGVPGQFLSNFRYSTGALAMHTTGNIYRVATVTLGAGNWTVCGNPGLTNATTVLLYMQASLSLVDATEAGAAAGGGNLDTSGGRVLSRAWTSTGQAVLALVDLQDATLCSNFTTAVSTPVYLNVRSSWTTSTPSAYGFLWAKRTF